MLNKVFVSRPFGLQHRQALANGEFLHRRRLQLKVAAFGFVGLGDDPNDFLFSAEVLEESDRNFRRTEK